MCSQHLAAHSGRLRLFAALLIATAICLSGCGKKVEPLEQAASATSAPSIADETVTSRAEAIKGGETWEQYDTRRKS